MQIQRSFKGDRATGTLFLVPTPIGNRDDMSYRMIQTLKEVDLIAAEDTRNTGLLLKHFEIATPQTSFHEHNAMEKIPDLLAHLESGKDLAQVSDAGLPSISDPGHDLVKAAIEREIPVVAVPGPCRHYRSNCQWPGTPAPYLLWLSSTQGRAAKGLFPGKASLS